MQTDLATLHDEAIKTIVKKNPLSEEQAQILITKEKSGRGRKSVIKFLDLQARKAKRRRMLKEALDEGILLPTV